MKRLSLGLLFGSLAALALACGGTIATSPESSDAGPVSVNDAGPFSLNDDASSPGDAGSPDVDAGSSLVPSDATGITVTAKGGFQPPTPDGSECSLVDSTYTLIFSTRELTWKICEYVEDGPHVYRTGQTTISEAALTTVEAALDELRRTTEPRCGADKPSEQIVFRTPKGDVTYYDDFYFCDSTDTTPYISGLDDLIGVLHELTK